MTRMPRTIKKGRKTTHRPNIACFWPREANVSADRAPRVCGTLQGGGKERGGGGCTLCRSLSSRSPLIVGSGVCLARHRRPVSLAVAMRRRVALGGGAR